MASTNSAITLKRNGLTVECVFAENGKPVRKMERYGREQGGNCS